MIGFSRARRSRRGRRPAQRPDARAARRGPGPARPAAAALTLHLRGTALDAYDGRAWSQSEPCDSARPSPTAGVDPSRAAWSRPDRQGHAHRPRADRSARDLPAARGVGPALQAARAARAGARRAACARARRARSATSRSTTAASSTTSSSAPERARRSSTLPAGERAALPRRSRPTCPPASQPRRGSGPTACASADEQGHAPSSTTCAPTTATTSARRRAGAKQPARRLPLRVEARALRVLLDGDGGDAPHGRHAHAQRDRLRRRHLQPLRQVLRGARRATRTRGSRSSSTTTAG